MTNLVGLHDRSAASATPAGTWVIDTIALSENPPPPPYDTSKEWIGRLNWGYGSTGTIPNSNQYEEMAARAVTYVAGSRGCHIWIIGNEPNLAREWPNHAPIYPWHYAACYRLCREAIHSLPGHERDLVLIAGPGPWNDQCKYNGNPNGDWVTYFVDVIDLLPDAFDGFSIHAYTHGYDPALVTSTARMDYPFGNRYYNFLCYRDFLNAVPAQYKHLPAYLTEANGDGVWQATGLIPAMAAEIDSWNQGGNKPQVKCLAFYLFSDEDEGARFEMGNKSGVMDEYYGTVAIGYQSPASAILPGPTPPKPQPPLPGPTPTPPLKWDARLDARGVTLTRAVVAPGEWAWRVVEGIFYPYGEGQLDAQGRRSDYVDVKKQGQRAVGTKITHWWSSGDDTKPAENKSDPWMTAQGKDGYALDFPFSASWPSYGVKVADGTPSDEVWGLGYGDAVNKNHHTASYFGFEWRQEGAAPEPPTPVPPHVEFVVALAGANLRAEPVTGEVLVAVPFGEEVNVYGSTSGDDGYQWAACTYSAYDGFIRSDLLSRTEPAPPEPPIPPIPPIGGSVVHPLPGAVKTQRFYQEPENYAKWNLQGHDGTDFGGKATGTPILAMADGRVIEVTYDATGYGNFVRVYHEQMAAQTLYCHASKVNVAVGDVVRAGQTIALVGSTGNSTGPHLHLEVRAVNEDGSYKAGTPMAKGRIDPETWAFLHGVTL